MKAFDGYVVVTRFQGGVVMVNHARRQLVVVGLPHDDDQDHHCDEMGCGQAHVVHRATISTALRCGYCSTPFSATEEGRGREHTLACKMNPLVQELERLKAKRTVGELLATTPRGTIVEYNGEHDGALFRQTRLDPRPGQAGIQSRWFGNHHWACWRSTAGVSSGLAPQPGADVDAVDLRRTGRVVLDADADGDPFGRGLMPRDDGGEA